MRCRARLSLLLFAPLCVAGCFQSSLSLTLDVYHGETKPIASEVDRVAILGDATALKQQADSVNTLLSDISERLARISAGAVREYVALELARLALVKEKEYEAMAAGFRGLLTTLFAEATAGGAEGLKERLDAAVAKYRDAASERTYREIDFTVELQRAVVSKTPDPDKHPAAVFVAALSGSIPVETGAKLLAEGMSDWARVADLYANAPSFRDSDVDMFGTTTVFKD
jgi:hypothetical protein